MPTPGATSGPALGFAAAEVGVVTVLSLAGLTELPAVVGAATPGADAS